MLRTATEVMLLQENGWHFHVDAREDDMSTRRGGRFKSAGELEQDAAEKALSVAKARVTAIRRDIEYASGELAAAEYALSAAQERAEGRVVFVRFGRRPYQTYAYEVPIEFPDLEKGDFVVTPAPAFKSFEGLAVVAGFGRDGYVGPLKPLVGFVIKRDGYVFGE